MMMMTNDHSNMSAWCDVSVQVKQIAKTPGYVRLLLKQFNEDDQQTNKWIWMAVRKKSNNLLLPDQLVNRFMGELKQCLRECQEDARHGKSGSKSQLTGDDGDEESTWRSEQLRHIDDRIKLRRHGPAIQMDVMRQLMPSKDSQKFYSVDMVPTIEISAGDGGKDEHFVAKPIKGSSKRIAWRRSFSLTEKSRLATLDKGNGCRKQVLRILKVIRNRKTNLVHLTSYHLTTILFKMIDKLSDSQQWKPECLGERLMDVIG